MVIRDKGKLGPEGCRGAIAPLPRALDIRAVLRYRVSMQKKTRKSEKIACFFPEMTYNLSLSLSLSLSL
jgi:hypothetical protein